MNHHLLKNIDIAEVGAPIAAGSSTDGNSDRLDMAGYDGVLFICPITDSVDTGVAALTVEQDTADADAGMAALSGGVATATSAADDDLNDKLLIVDVYKPTKRYVQAVRTSLTANIAFGSLIAIRYKSSKRPITAHASILQQILAVSPAES